MASSTRSNTQAAFDHLLSQVFNWSSTTPGYIALAYCGYKTITDLVTMTKEEVEELTEDGSKPIPRVQKR